MIDIIRKYFEKQVQLIKLETIVIVANVVSSLASSILLLVLFLLILFMFNFALAFWLGQVLGSIALGFLLVGIFYTAIFVIYLYVSKDKVELKIKDQIVKSALSSEKKNNKTNKS
jgi:hypothetical protein